VFLQFLGPFGTFKDETSSHLHLQDIALGRGARKAMTRVVLVLLLCGSAAAIIGKEYVSLHSK
jgi:hypothetical protein